MTGNKILHGVRKTCGRIQFQYVPAEVYRL